MIPKIKEHLQTLDLDVRKSGDARFMDQKVTPDVLSIMADCVVNFDADRNVEFTKNDIWNAEYFNTNVKSIFNKPDARNDTTRLEYDKFTSQPLRTLAYAGILSMHKSGNTNVYCIGNREILEFIAMREKNSYQFLFHYLTKVLSDSNELRYFDAFKKKCIDGSVAQIDFYELKDRFQRFIIGNTPIKGVTEVNRIFPKILNIYACEHNVHGTIGGRLSPHPFYYSDLMYNRPNWRDGNKIKNISRNEAIIEHEARMMMQNQSYSDYQVQKAMNVIRRMYTQSEVHDQWSKGDATQVHHIFPRSEFPQLAHYCENLIKLTPTQHYTKAHPSNKTDAINRDYQLVCLLAKSDSIEQSIRRHESIYRKESFVHVINVGLSQTMGIELPFRGIKQRLTSIYNAM